MLTEAYTKMKIEELWDTKPRWMTMRTIMLMATRLVRLTTTANGTRMNSLITSRTLTNPATGDRFARTKVRASTVSSICTGLRDVRLRCREMVRKLATTRRLGIRKLEKMEGRRCTADLESANSIVNRITRLT